MVVILLGLIFGVHAQWWGSRPRWRDAFTFTKIYLDPAERHVTGSRFVDVQDRGAEGAACDCQGICGYGRGGGDGHLIFGDNKKSGAKGCHWCGHPQYDPSPGNKDKIVYCYNHVCNEGYVSICEQYHPFNIWETSYSRKHRACTCASAAGTWQRVEGNFADISITTSTTQYTEYTYSVTKTHTVAIETSASVGVEVKGVGASSTVTMTEEFSKAIENSWTFGASSTREISFHCDSGGSDKTTAWQYVVYMYDVLCAGSDRKKRFIAYSSENSDGCAISAFLMAGEGITCTKSKKEPPCCGPGHNPTGVNERKFCTDDYESWTGQCDTYEHRTKWTSIEDDSNWCKQKECVDWTDSGLRDELSICGNTCANNAYANVFLPSDVINAPNMLSCDANAIAWIENWLQTTPGGFCKNVRSKNHVVALVTRDCGVVGFGSGSQFDQAYKNAEDNLDEFARRHNLNYESLDYLPVYYNNWPGVHETGLCDGHMGRRLLKTDEDSYQKTHQADESSLAATNERLKSTNKRLRQTLAALSENQVGMSENQVGMVIGNGMVVEVPGSVAGKVCHVVGPNFSSDGIQISGVPWPYYNVLTKEDCQRLCLSNSECNGFHYYGLNDRQAHARGACYIKRLVTKVQPQTDNHDRYASLCTIGSSLCSSNAVHVSSLSDTVHACEGTWGADGWGHGVEGGAWLLCASGAKLCGYDDMQTVSSESCNSLTGFYATAVSSHMHWVCNSDDSGENDIWGCGDTCTNSNAPCGSSMTCAIGTDDIGGWAGLSDLYHRFNEKSKAYVVGPNAGVLCCAI